MAHKIGFNKPYLTGKETEYIRQAVETRKISGDGKFTKLCHQFFESRFGIKKALLTSSCTDALEMAAILLDLKEGDEVIMPSFTFVSTANAFILRGAHVVFADSESNHPNLDIQKIEALITPRTKAIVVVHYAGVSCDMDAVMKLSEKHGIPVVEDAAQAIDAYYKGKALGSIGSLSAFSFHETKNIMSGEGGLLGINDPRFFNRAEIIREKGTNRSSFFRGEVDKYGWVDIGSSFLPSEITAAFLYAQLENLDEIQKKRVYIWKLYHEMLKPLESKGKVKLPVIPDFGSNNAHMFYLVCKDLDSRSGLIAHLNTHGINAVFHYISLHKSPFYQNKYKGNPLPHSDFYTDTLVRLPLYYELKDEEVKYVAEKVIQFFSA